MSNPSQVFAQLWPLIFLPAVALIAFSASQHRTRLGIRRLITVATLRASSVVLLVLALMMPGMATRVDAVSVIYALDVSHSVSPDYVQAALQWVRESNARAKPSHTRYVVFADHAVMLDTLEDVEALLLSNGATAINTRAAVDQSATNLEAAIDAALSGFAPEHARRLVLLSDGNATEGEVWRAFGRAKNEGVRIFTFPAPASQLNRAWVEAIEIPGAVREREPVAVTIRLFSRGSARARVQLEAAGVSIGARDVDLKAGANSYAAEVLFTRNGLQIVSARISVAGDPMLKDDRYSRTLWVRPRPRILYLESAPASARYLRDALLSQGIEVQVAHPETWARDGAPLAGYEAVILSDVPAAVLTPQAANNLEVFVKDGGALIFTAGEQTYGAQGYGESQVEALLPVKFEAARQKKEIDLVLLLDRSFSMRGKKLEYAKTAALATLDLLGEQHRLAVVAFDSQAHDVVPLLEVGNKRRAEDAISAITANGETHLYQALRHAEQLLHESQARTKHIILLSDGETTPPGASRGESASANAMQILRRQRGDPTGEEGSDDTRLPESSDASFREFAQRLAASKVTLSTVTVGERPDQELMANLARWGGGKNYLAARDDQVVSLFVAEAKRLLEESIVEQAFRPVLLQGSPAIAGLDFSRGPQLNGFVISRAKPYAEILLEASDHYPLLVQWHYGLGRSLAFLSDVKNRWASDWLEWPGYAKLWAQVVRESVRADSGQEFSLAVTRRRRSAQISLQVLSGEGRYRNELTPSVRVAASGGESRIVALGLFAPGTYRAEVPLWSASTDSYRFELVETAGIGTREIAMAGIQSLEPAYTDEFRFIAPDFALLRALAQQSGGKFAPDVGEIFALHGDGGWRREALWPYLVCAALALFMVELLLRRWPTPLPASV